jgi:hypothetical protein
MFRFLFLIIFQFSFFNSADSSFLRKEKSMSEDCKKVMNRVKTSSVNYEILSYIDQEKLLELQGVNKNFYEKYVPVSFKIFYERVKLPFPIYWHTSCIEGGFYQWMNGQWCLSKNGQDNKRKNDERDQSNFKKYGIKNDNQYQYAINYEKIRQESVKGNELHIIFSYDKLCSKTYTLIYKTDKNLLLGEWCNQKYLIPHKTYWREKNEKYEYNKINVTEYDASYPSWNLIKINIERGKIKFLPNKSNTLISLSNK